MTAYSIDVSVSAPVKPTEVPERVARAIEELFPNAVVEIERDRVTATGHTVDRFGERLREQQILDTARSHLRTQIETDTIRFRLKKQAAFVGDVNFGVGNLDELGEITVEIQVSDPSPMAFLDEVVPETDEDGTPIE